MTSNNYEAQCGCGAVMTVFFWGGGGVCHSAGTVILRPYRGLQLVDSSVRSKNTKISALISCS